MTGYI